MSKKINIDLEKYPGILKYVTHIDGKPINRCEHVFDDTVGYGLHCVKCGYKPKSKKEQDFIKRTEMNTLDNDKKWKKQLKR